MPSRKPKTRSPPSVAHDKPLPPMPLTAVLDPQRPHSTRQLRQHMVSRVINNIAPFSGQPWVMDQQLPEDVERACQSFLDREGEIVQCLQTIFVHRIRYEHLADTCVREYVKLELSRYASPSAQSLSRRAQEEQIEKLLDDVRQHTRHWLSISRVESLAQAEHMRETMFALEGAFWRLNEEPDWLPPVALIENDEMELSYALDRVLSNPAELEEAKLLRGNEAKGFLSLLKQNVDRLDQENAMLCDLAWDVLDTLTRTVKGPRVRSKSSRLARKSDALGSVSDTEIGRGYGSEVSENSSPQFHPASPPSSEASVGPSTVTEFVQLDPWLHRYIKEEDVQTLIESCGGPTDRRTQRDLVRFPRDKATGHIRIRGPPQLVAKLKEELELAAELLREEWGVLGIAIPVWQHSTLKGPKSRNFRALERETGVKIIFPDDQASVLWGHVVPRNVDQLTDADPSMVVKCGGPIDRCEEVIEELQARLRALKGLQSRVVAPLLYFCELSEHYVRTRFSSQGVYVESVRRPRNSYLIPPSAAQEAVAIAPGTQWSITSNYAPESRAGNFEWKLTAKDLPSLEHAEGMFTEMLTAVAMSASHIGFLTLPDPQRVAFVVGPLGQTVHAIEAETKTTIKIARGERTIVIIGTQTGLEAAKNAILRITHVH
ncbi:hypothetical protein BOTBODRAFT_31771 [Botryobasidium botryosum FD-172 SS1]|uniref:K Homology domain-containing protein n=1 Tax=Botryobasidium botryosum (strain FD-172 SS1) TaxID=930990 RepID=A0A067MUB2_BOTB1|nr:hypothetical protein BOTBODRAFT_31771 [Botryobasidium botryosum FD-172 SS1]